jgi:hypothetical protein
LPPHGNAALKGRFLPWGSLKAKAPYFNVDGSTQDKNAYIYLGPTAPSPDSGAVPGEAANA